MTIYLVGACCVGKTTIGRMLSQRLGFAFYDIDEEIEKYYQKPIERIQNECLSMNGFREKGSIVLDFIFSKNDFSVVASTPSGLMHNYLRIYKKQIKRKKIVSIHIKDEPENILNRLTFYDVDSKPIRLDLNESERKKYLKSIVSDYNYFKESYKRADIQVDISGMNVDNIPDEILKILKEKNITK